MGNGLGFHLMLPIFMVIKRFAVKQNPQHLEVDCECHREFIISYSSTRTLCFA